MRWKAFPPIPTCYWKAFRWCFSQLGPGGTCRNGRFCAVISDLLQKTDAEHEVRRLERELNGRQKGLEELRVGDSHSLVDRLSWQ